MRSFRAAGVFLAVSCFSVPSATAAVITFTGFDSGASAPGVNSTAARNSFIAAVGDPTLITFENATVGPTSNSESIDPGVTITAGGSIATIPGCDLYYCGGNTIAGGSTFLEVRGGTMTFSFLTPINSFGANFGGVQVNTTTITFNDGTSQTITIAPSAQIAVGGFAFVGFTDFGASISSISINAVNDLMTMDDIATTTASVSIIANPSITVETPEPSTFLLVAFGLGALAIFRRRAVSR
jgi:hypothetical protein